jgi:hypothetical protein
MQIHSIKPRGALEEKTLTGVGLTFTTRFPRLQARQPSNLPYTTEEIAARLGISMAVFQKEPLGARHVAAIRAVGIQRIELIMMPPAFDVLDSRQVSEVLSECRRTSSIVRLPSDAGDELSEGSVLRFAALDLRVVPAHHEIQAGNDDHHARAPVAETTVRVVRCVGPVALTLTVEAVGPPQPAVAAQVITLIIGLSRRT